MNIDFVDKYMSTCNNMILLVYEIFYHLLVYKSLESATMIGIRFIEIGLDDQTITSFDYKNYEFIYTPHINNCIKTLKQFIHCSFKI